MSQGSSDAAESAEQGGVSILVVEDDSRTLRLERFILEEEGYRVEEAGSGEEALEKIGQVDPTLVMLDVGLPGISGFAVCERIRESSKVPIIMVTGEDRDEDKVRGLELGADDYVTKPFSTLELAARVKAVLRRYDPPVAPPPQPKPKPAPETCSSPQPGVTVPEEYEGPVRLVVENTRPYRRLIQFIDDIHHNPQLHVLGFVTNQPKETIHISVMLREPIPLKSVLLEMKDVSQVDTPPESSNQQEEAQLHVFLRS